MNYLGRDTACRVRKRLCGCRRTWHAMSLLLMLMPLSVQSQSPSTFTAAWWNVENLFDTRDDPRTADDDFTPRGDYHWTRRKLGDKIQGLYKTLLEMELPDVVGLAEVENAYVLRELCNGTPLREAGYRYVHYDSPDRRGIDCALLYRRDRFRVIYSRPLRVSDSTSGFYTRDILQVEGITPEGDTVVLFLNHWPSKRGGEEADQHRMRIAQKLRSQMLRLHKRYPQAAIIALGDMNSTADEPAIADGMGFRGDSVNPDGIRNLDYHLPTDWGSHKFQGQWRYIDAVFFLADQSWTVRKLKLIRFDHLLTLEDRRPGVRPRRTNQGPRYEGGLSDHLPLLLKISRNQY